MYHFPHSISLIIAIAAILDIREKNVRKNQQRVRISEGEGIIKQASLVSERNTRQTNDS